MTAANVQPSGVYLYSIEYDDHDVEHRVAEKYLRHIEGNSPQAKRGAASVVKQVGFLNVFLRRFSLSLPLRLICSTCFD